MTDSFDLIPLVRQQLAWDMLPCEHDYWRALELTPPSDEGRDTMHAQSHTRMHAVEPFKNFVDTYSILTADIITEVMYQNLLKHLDGEEIPGIETWHEVTRKQNREIVRGAVYPILAHLMDSGLMMPVLYG